MPAENHLDDYVPTEDDYDRARTVGAGNEPELPAGVVRKLDEDDTDEFPVS